MHAAEVRVHVDQQELERHVPNAWRTFDERPVNLREECDVSGHGKIEAKSGTKKG